MATNTPKMIDIKEKNASIKKVNYDILWNIPSEDILFHSGLQVEQSVMSAVNYVVFTHINIENTLT